MVVAFDADFLSLFYYSEVIPPNNPETKSPVDHAHARIDQLVQDLEASRSTIIIPTPAFAEFLVYAGEGEGGDAVVKAIERRRVFRIEPFGNSAALEAAKMTRDALAGGDKRSGAVGPWQCIKADRQILAVAKEHGATKAYSNDQSFRRIADTIGIEAVPVWELPVPVRQAALPFNGE